MIAHQLDIGRTPVFLLSMSNFKSVVSFGFFIQNYTMNDIWIFVKPENGLVWSVFAFKKVFPGSFRDSIGPELNIDFLLSQTIARISRA